MCTIELEPCEVWNETERTARKAHRCSCCRRVIAAGERYVTVFSVYEGERDFQRACQECHAARVEFADAHDAVRSQPDYFAEMLSECIADGDEESERRWKPMLAAIHARGGFEEAKP